MKLLVLCLLLALSACHRTSTQACLDQCFAQANDAKGYGQCVREACVPLAQATSATEAQ